MTDFRDTLVAVLSPEPPRAPDFVAARRLHQWLPWPHRHLHNPSADPKV